MDLAEGIKKLKDHLYNIETVAEEVRKQIPQLEARVANLTSVDNALRGKEAQLGNLTAEVSGLERKKGELVASINAIRSKAEALLR